MFPVVDFPGEVTGHSGRISTINKTAKYQPPEYARESQTSITARLRVVRAGGLCEGNVDVIALWEYGLEGSRGNGDGFD